ncbi:MAG: rod shape-determining protein MreC [Deltaproteobacteria bacterium]|nr:rod shape-determining protein MreC [Candidatus Anaeroferrophillus wilburensis]MBN2888175.1 rod shape-determining protein MreC [Deltaproteobacteria bacterium]
MTAFTRRHQLLLYILVIFLVTTFFLGLKTRQFQLLATLEKGVMMVAYPFQKGADLAIDTCNSIIEGYVTLVHVKQENRALKNRIANLERQLIARQEEHHQNEQLRKLLDFQDTHLLPPHITIANIIGRDAGNFSQLVFVDRGSRDRIKKHSPALTHRGIVGRVIAVSPFSAKVMLITDNHSSCDVMIQRTRERGILQGGNQALCKINYLLRSADVQVGDTVITSGMDKIFPKGMPVGTVVSVQKEESGLSQEIIVEPFANLNGLEEIIITASPEPGGVNDQ